MAVQERVYHNQRLHDLALAILAQLTPGGKPMYVLTLPLTWVINDFPYRFPKYSSVFMVFTQPYSTMSFTKVALNQRYSTMSFNRVALIQPYSTKGSNRVALIMMTVQCTRLPRFLELYSQMKNFGYLWAYS